MFVGKGYQQDISKLKGMQMLGSIILLNNMPSQHSLTLDARINGDVFLSLNESRLGQPGVSLGFQFAIMNIIADLICDNNVMYTAL